MADKKTLVILPGWGGNRQTWNEFISVADEKFDVVCIDLPCFGSEPCPDRVWGVEDYAEFVKNKIKQLDKKDIILIGHSFGGQVASYLVAHEHDLVDKLILSGAAVFRPRKALRRWIFSGLAKLSKHILRIPILEKYNIPVRKVIYKVINSPDYSRTSGIKRDIFKKIIRQDLTKLLFKIKTPTLVVWGSKDKFVPLKHGKRIKQLIPKCKLKIIKGGRHGLHLQMPEKLLEIVYAFSH